MLREWPHPPASYAALPRADPDHLYDRFDYGDWNTTNTDGVPFIQMISTTDSATMWHDFQTNRTATLAQLPLPLDPALIVHYEGGSSSSTASSPTTTSTSTTSSTANPTATTATTTTSSSPSGATQAPDSLAANLSGAVSTDGTPSAGDDSWGNKYGKVVLALLAANLAVGLALLAVVVTMCMRRRRESSSSGPGRYAPVRFKEPVEEYGRGSVVSGSD